MGCEVIGIDLEPKMIKGAQKNLQRYLSPDRYELMLADARSLPFRQSINSIATDPPYGKSTSTFGKEIRELLVQFFEQAHDILTSGGTIAIGMLSEIPLREIVEDTGYKLELYEKMYIPRKDFIEQAICDYEPRSKTFDLLISVYTFQYMWHKLEVVEKIYNTLMSENAKAILHFPGYLINFSERSLDSFTPVNSLNSPVCGVMTVCEFFIKEGFFPTN